MTQPTTLSLHRTPVDPHLAVQSTLDAPLDPVSDDASPRAATEPSGAGASPRFASGGDEHPVGDARRAEEAGVAARLARALAEHALPRDVSSSCSHRARFESAEAARAAYGRAVDSLLDVNTWGDGLSAASADFALFDAEGRHVVGRRAQEGDFIRIDLPGPVPMSWVRIEQAQVGQDRASIEVRPTFDPTARPRTPEVTAHFFTSEATNTFTLARRGDRLRMSVEGRHETPNVGSEAGSAAGAVGHRATSVGAWAGMQHQQWDELTERIVEGAR